MKKYKQLTQAIQQAQENGESVTEVELPYHSRLERGSVCRIVLR